MSNRIVVVCIVLLWGAVSLPGQESPFLDAKRFRGLRNEISGDIAYDYLRTLVQFHAPNGGSRGFRAEAAWVEQKAREVGLADVRYIPLKFTGTAWTPLSGELWLLAPEEVKLASYDEVATTVIDYSPSADITAELVDVGEGTQESDYAGKDVKGKIVLAGGPPQAVRQQAVTKRGAVGIVSYSTSRAFRYEHPDQVHWLRFTPPRAGQPAPPPGISISQRTALWLRWLLRPEARRAPGIPEDAPVAVAATVRVRMRIESELPAESMQGLVEGYIRGTGRGPAIVLTAHMQEEKTSANDDRSGVANLLEIARALNRLIREGKIARPQRDIRFWWVNEFAAEYQYFSEHPEEPRRMLANINQDMVGALQSADSREQHVTRTPFSRASFLSDVVESIVTAMVEGNTSFLSAAAPSRGFSLYTKPVLSRLGSRERYGARVVPYFDSTDHHAFNEGFIGVAGVTFTNWPDEYIHSSDDDLWQIDRTQLQRNALAVSAATLYLAGAGEEQVREMAGYMAAAGRQRVWRDLQAGLDLVRQAAKSGGAMSAASAYWDADNLVRQAVAREARALASLAAFEGSPATWERARKALLAEEPAYRAQLAELYELSTAAKPPRRPEPSEAEKRCSARVPQNSATVGQYLDRRNQMKPVPGIHSLMRFEVLNFVDGKNTCLDIYKAVRAEAQAAGAWYYGQVTLDDVVRVLENAAEAQMIAWKGQ